MKTKDEILQAIQIAKELNMTSIDIDGVKYELNAKPTGPVQEAKPEDIINPLPVLDEMDEDEIKYWATPYYDEMQANKELQVKLTNEEKADGKDR